MVTPAEAVEIIAAHIASVGVQEAIERHWPEISDADWEAIHDRLEALAWAVPMHTVQAAFALLADRATEVDS